MTMNRQEFLTRTGLEVETLEFWIGQEWLIPEQTSAGANFSDVDLGRAHLIRDLKGDLGVNDEGIDVILHLLDQIHGLRHAFQRMRDDLQTDRR